MVVNGGVGGEGVHVCANGGVCVCEWRCGREGVHVVSIIVSCFKAYAAKFEW